MTRDREIFKHKGRYYVASRVYVSHRIRGDEWETMVFPSKETGEITSFTQLYETRDYEILSVSISKFKEANV
jgi:hypothetical protein